MATLQLYRYFVTDVDGRQYHGGALTQPVSLTLGSDLIYEQVFSVGTETTKKIFDVDQDLADFDFLWVETDYDVMLELVTDDDADVGEEVYTMLLEGTGTANSYGPPFILGGDDSYANYTVNFAGGTLDVIETIRVRNTSTTNTARVHIFAGT